MSVLSEVLKIEEEDFEQLCNIYNDKERYDEEDLVLIVKITNQLLEMKTYGNNKNEDLRRIMELLTVNNFVNDLLKETEVDTRLYYYEVRKVLTLLITFIIELTVKMRNVR